MSKVTIENEDRSIEVADGGSLKEAMSDSKMLFGCKNGLCGTCCIDVLEGSSNLSLIEGQEKETLKDLDCVPGQRLGCQCKVKGDVKIRYINSV